MVVEKSQEAISSQKEGVSSLVNQIMRDMNRSGTFRFDRGIALWLRVLEIDGMVKNGKYDVLTRLVEAKSLAGEESREESFFNTFVDRYIPVLTLKKEDNNIEQERLALLGKIYEVGTVDQMERVIDSIERGMALQDDGGAGLIDRLAGDRQWAYILDRSKEQDEIGIYCRKKMVEHVQENGFAMIVSSVFRNMACLNEAQINNRVEILAGLLGIEENMAKDMAHSWITLDFYGLKKSDRSKWRSNYWGFSIFCNLDSIWKLKKDQSVGREGVEGLYNIYGITNFSRYPLPVLKKQWEDRDDTESAYGVWFSSYSDHNRALVGEGSAIREFWRNLPKGYKMRIVEARDRYSAVKRLMTLDRMYGAKQKISFLVINTHGNSEVISLGSDQVEDRLLGSLVNTKSAKKLRSVYAPKMPVAILSCSTGKVGGIAEKYSEYFGGEVVAPDDICASPSPIFLRRLESGKLVFHVSFEGGERGSMVPSNRFVAGRKIEEN